MDTVLEAQDLTKHYEEFALQSVSLAVRRGTIAGIFGANGAGKSALLKVLAHQAPCRAGAVRVFGVTYAAGGQELMNRIGYGPQEPAFHADKAVQWVARFAAPYFAQWDGAGFYRLLDEFKVNPLKKVKHLSGGQRKLLSVALALSHGAELLILDEPTVGLDVVHRRALLDRLSAFVADGDKTVIVASHVTDGLDEIAEEVWFLDAGRIVMHADKDDLLAQWKWVHFKEAALPRALEDRLVSVRRLPFGNRGLTSEYDQLRQALAASLASGDAKLENASLEDILLSFVKEA